VASSGLFAAVALNNSGA